MWTVANKISFTATSHRFSSPLHRSVPFINRDGEAEGSRTVMAGEEVVELACFAEGEAVPGIAVDRAGVVDGEAVASSPDGMGATEAFGEFVNGSLMEFKEDSVSTVTTPSTDANKELALDRLVAKTPPEEATAVSKSVVENVSAALLISPETCTTTCKATV